MAEKTVDICIEEYSKYILQPIKTVVELGARDCKESVRFSNLLPNARIFAFECNPNTIGLCRANIHDHVNISLIEKAVTDKNSKIKFYSINPQKTTTTWEDGNPGASSVFRASGKYPIEQYVQDEIEVDSITLEKFLHENNIEDVDLLWMDIQGAELMALKGCGKRIKHIKFIHLEVEFMEIYEQQPLFKDIDSFLKSCGFVFLKFTIKGSYSGDAIYLNQSLLSKPSIIFINIKNNLLFLYYSYVKLIKTIKYFLKHLLTKHSNGRANASR